MEGHFRKRIPMGSIDDLASLPKSDYRVLLTRQSRSSRRREGRSAMQLRLLISLDVSFTIALIAKQNQVEYEGQPLDNGNDTMSLASRRPRRHNVLMPKRYRDLLPQAAPSLPPPDLRPPLLPRSNTAVEMDTDSTTHLEPGLSLCSPVSHIICTPRNIFGLVRQYFGDQLPSVNPEEHIILVDLSPSPSTENSSQSQLRSKWWPFPNRNSFLWEAGTGMAVFKNHSRSSKISSTLLVILCSIQMMFAIQNGARFLPPLEAAVQMTTRLVRNGWMWMLGGGRNKWR